MQLDTILATVAQILDDQVWLDLRLQEAHAAYRRGSSRRTTDPSSLADQIEIISDDVRHHCHRTSFTDCKYDRCNSLLFRKPG